VSAPAGRENAVVGWSSIILAAGMIGCGDATSPGAGAEDSWDSSRVLFQDQAIRVEKVSYRSEGLQVFGLVCRPLSPDRHQVLMVNHGGWAGLGQEWEPTQSGCAAASRNGYVVIEPAYRGEDGSEGTIELCAGEAADVRTMVSIILRQPYVDPNASELMVLGGSHGGCITLRAIADGLPAGRAVAAAGPTDWALVYRALEDSITAGSTPDRLSSWQFLASEVVRYLGGTPAQVPAVYASRSILTHAGAIAGWGGKLLVQHGVDDEIVPVEQSCALAATGGFRSYHVDASGAVRTEPPRACVGFGLAWLPGPLPAEWPDRRYLIVYESLSHGAGLNAARQGADALSFLLAR
jgi:dipeptidyl aminopeptidase/acylaminoacyl peptidase